MEKEVIRGFQPALQTGYSSLLINAGEYSSFHRLFVDPVTRAMFSSRGEDFAFMQKAQKEAGQLRKKRRICWRRKIRQ
jgi:conjugal transfer ATP-binding protein TraC